MIARLAAATVALVLLDGPGRSGPVEITAIPVASFQTFGFGETFGPLAWQGGLALSSPDPRFGGLSGLVLTDSCAQLLAVSDAGNWFRARLQYADGRLSGLSSGEMAPMRDSKGRAQRSKVWGDAEAVAAAGSGRIAVAFESRVRFGTYDIAARGLDAPFVPMPYPKEINRGPDNGEVESLGRLASGSWLAIAEKNRDNAGNIRAWVWRGRGSTAFSVRRHADYDVTDLAVLPDGKVLTLERSFSPGSLPGMAIRRFDPARIGSGVTIEPELLFEGRMPFYRIDNMEGIAVCQHKGETRITLLSDDNFNRRVQTTLLLQFAYRP